MLTIIFILILNTYFLPGGIIVVVLLLILGLTCTSSSPVGVIGLIEADTLIVGLLVVVGSSSLVATGVNRDTAGADVVIDTGDCPVVVVVVGPIVITEVILVDIVVIDTGNCPVVADVIVTDGSLGVVVDIGTGDCPVVAVVIVIDGSLGVVVDIGTGDCPVVVVDIATGDCPGDVVIVGRETGDCPLDCVLTDPGDSDVHTTNGSIVVDIGTGDFPEVVVDIATGDCPGDVVIVDRETGDCPLDSVVTGPGDFDGEGVVSIGDVEGRPVGAASHWEKVSEVLGSVAWKQNWSSGFPSFI